MELNTAATLEAPASLATLLIHHELSGGLKEVLAQVPVGKGYAQLEGGLSRFGGAYGRAEAGWHVSKPVAVFGYGQLDRAGPQLGAGLRFSF